MNGDRLVAGREDAMWIVISGILRRRAGTRGLSTNGSHIGWAIAAIVIVGGLLAALHSLWLPWMQGVFTNMTGISTSTTTTP